MVIWHLILIETVEANFIFHNFNASHSTYQRIVIKITE